MPSPLSLSEEIYAIITTIMKMTILSMAMLMITIMMLMVKMTMSMTMMMTMMTDPSHVGSFEQLLGSDGNVVEEAEAHCL